LVIISYTTGLSFAKERIGPLAAIIITVFYLLALYLFALPYPPENPLASIYSDTLIKTTSQHLLLLVGFDTLIYQKYYDTPPILVGHQRTANSFIMLVMRTLWLERNARVFNRKATTAQTLLRLLLDEWKAWMSCRRGFRREIE
jgi:hypothetical protein